MTFSLVDAPSNHEFHAVTGGSFSLSLSFRLASMFLYNFPIYPDAYPHIPASNHGKWYPPASNCCVMIIACCCIASRNAVARYKVESALHRQRILILYRSLCAFPAPPRLTYPELSSFDSRPFELRYQTFAARAIGRFSLRNTPFPEFAIKFTTVFPIGGRI